MENAGKTTIVDFLTKETYIIPRSLPMTQPTKGVERSTLQFQDKIVSVWDFGGQELYRNEYMAQPELYFSEVSVVYYVVDVQDRGRSISSQMYFTGMIQLLRKFSPKVKIVFLFHKSDPKYDTSILHIKDQFLTYIDIKLKKLKLAYEAHETSIFMPESILTAFKIEE